MPDPALEIAGQLFAFIAGPAEEAGQLLTNRFGLVPDFFGLRSHRFLQWLENLLLQPLGTQDGDGQRRQARGQK